MTEYSNNQAVFNCVLNPAMRKKKKIPSVLPPPPPTVHPVGGGKAATPFWKEPLPIKQDSIRQKLQSKRENQLKQLQLLENEMRGSPSHRRGLHVHRDPAMPPPYLNIHDPLHDSSGDQGMCITVW